MYTNMNEASVRKGGFAVIKPVSLWILPSPPFVLVCAA